MTTAILFPDCENIHAAVAEAMRHPPAKALLATDGKRVAWLPRISTADIPSTPSPSRRVA